MPDVAQHTLHAADSSGHWPITVCHEGLKTTQAVWKRFGAGFTVRTGTKIAFLRKFPVCWFNQTLADFT